MSRLKIDISVSVGITLLCLLFGLSFDYFFDWSNPWFIIVFIPALTSLYSAIVYKKHFEEVTEWKKQLNLTEEDLTRLSHATKYDIPKWEKGKVTLPWTKMCRLADRLEEMVQKN